MTLSADLAQPILAFSLLAVAMWEDVRSRKIRNQLLLVGLVLILSLLTFTQGSDGFINSGLSMLMACSAVIPLYLLRVLGGGDIKLFILVSLLFSWEQVLVALFAALIWGSVLGIIQVLLKGQGKEFVRNLLALVRRTPVPTEATHKTPFAVALFLGFATSYGRAVL